MAQSWYDSAWTSRQKLTINSNAAAYSLSASLTRFPFLVKITDSGNDLFARAQASGNDILFTAEDGATRIPHEIENFSNGGTKDLTVWVQLPTFRYDAVTVIYMYYGNPSVGSQQQKREVWDATYGSVYHLKETGTSGNYEDSTRYANAGLGGTITVNQAPTRSTDSIAGYSEDFDGADDFIKVPGHMGEPANVTVSAWANLDAPSSVLGSTVFSIGDSLVLSLDHNNTTGHVAGFIYDGTDWRVTDTTVTVAGTGWHHVAYRIDDATHRSYVYIDGVQQGTASFTGSPAYTLGADTYIGKHGNGDVGVEFNGRIDELKFSAASRSPDWIKTEYQTQAASAQGAPASPDTVDSTRFIKQKERQLPYFQYKRAVTINGGMVVGTHTDFPVLVHVTLDPGHVMNADGYDTMFTDASGVPLSHEIESYNSGTGELWAWVKVPTLHSSADTILYLYYGNGSLVSPPSASAVWNTGYGMVQHLNIDPSGSQTDSTANGNNGTSNGMTSGNLVDAMIGKGVQFDGSHYITVPSSASLNATSALTLSAWAKLTNSTNDQKIIGKTNGPAPARGYLMGAQTAGLYPETWDSLGTHRTFNSGTITSGQWTYLTLTSTANGNLIGYVNGVQVNSISAGTNNLGTSAGALVMGAAPWDPTQLRATGTLDEMRVSTSVRSANWIATEYNNQSDTTIGAGKFIKSLGAETAAYSSWWNAGWNYCKTLTLNADKVGTNNIPKDNSDLANMPVLLSFTDTEIGSIAQWSGNDIAFVINGQKLDHELVSFDKSSGKIIVWVKIPAISSSRDTRVDAYYGNPTAAGQQNAAETWSNGFSGVWHLEEAGGGVSSVYRDSSPAGNNGTSGTFTVTGTPTAVAAKIAGGQSFNGTSNTITTSWSIVDPQEFTLSAWVNTSSTTGHKIIGFENAQTGTGSTVYDRSLWIGTDGRAYFGCYSGTTDIAVSTSTYNNSAWHYLVGVRNDTTNTLYLYADGAQVGTKANASAEVRTQWWRFGSYRNGGWTNGADGYFPGTLDEVRISYAPRSADWVKAEYVNQNAPGSNITIDPPPTLWTWSGASGAPWSVNGNWDQGIYPNDNTRQVLVGGTAGPQLDQNITIKRLTIQAAHSVDLNGYTLSIDDANGLENQGTLYFSGRTGASTDAISRMDTTSGMVVYRTTAASIRDFGAVDYSNLTIDGIAADLVSDITVAKNLVLANSATLNLNGCTLTVQGDLTGTGTVTVGSGTLVAEGNLTVSALSATSGTIRVSRIFNPGSFAPGTGTVELVDPAWNGEILGSRTFNNLRIATPAKTVLFQNGTTQTVANFTVTGTMGFPVGLRSTTDGSQWTIAPATKSVSYAYVRDSIASSVISANNSTNGGNNNVNWQFNSAGQLHHFAISTIATPQIAGVPFPITITAQDVSNATVAGFTGTVTISDRTGTITPVVSGSFVGGVRTETVTVGAAATNVTVVVSNGMIVGQSTSFDVQAYSPFVGLIGHWRFEGGSGTTAVDSSVSSNPGTLIGGPTWTTGRVGGALSFSGTNYVSVANEATYDITGNITVAAWIKVDTFAIQWQTIVAKGDSAWRLLRNSTTNALCFAGTGLTTDTVYGTRNVNDAQWHHAVGVYDGARLSLYIDGTLDASIASTGAIGTNNYNVFIGENAQMTGRQFDGLIDDVRVYNRALSATEVSGLYYAAPPLLTAVGIASNNAVASLAKVGDEITVSFTGSQPLMALPSVIIAGHAATVVNMAGTAYTAKYTMAAGDAEGLVTFSIDYSNTVGVPGTQVTSTTNASSVTFDRTVPVISATAPATNAFVNSTKVSYTLSEALGSGSITWTRTGGSTDGSSPHQQALAGGELGAGAHTDITLASPPTLVDGVVYTISFNGSDLAGNVATTVSSTTVTYDATLPTIMVAETADLNGNGLIDALHITFSEAVKDSTVTASNFDVAGVSGEGFSSTTAGDTADDPDIYITFTEDAAIKTDAGPTVAYTAGSLTDLHGNPLGTTAAVTATDKAGPAIVAAQTVTTTTVQVTFSEAVSDASLVVGDFVFAGFTTGAANTNPTGISSGTANDAVVMLTLAAEIGADETGTVAFTAAGVANDLVPNTSSQTAAVAVSDGIGAVPQISTVSTGDADSDGQIDRLIITFDKNVDIVDGSAADAFPQVLVVGYTVANADYAVASTTTLTLTLAESGSADSGATPNVTFANEGNVRDSVTRARAANYGPAAASDNAGPAIVSAQTVTTTTVQVILSEAVSDASLVVADFVLAGFTTGAANTNPTGISSGTANDAVVTLTLAAEIGPDETGTVAFTAAAVASDSVTNTSSQTAAVAVSDGIGAVPQASSVSTWDADGDGKIDRVFLTFDKNVDIVDGSAADGFPEVGVAGYTIANGDYAAANTTTVILNLAEGASADTAATPNVTFTNDGDVRDSVTHALAANYGPAAASDGAGPAVVSAQTVATTTVQVTFSEAVSDASIAVGDFVFGAFATPGANANATGISSGTANDSVVTLTLAAEIGPDETGTVAFTAAAVGSDLAANTSSQTAAVSVTDGIGAVPAVSSVRTGDADSDGQIDRLVLTFNRNVDIADGSAADGFPQVVVTGYTIVNANYAAANTTTLTLTLTESGTADSGATPNTTFTNDGDVRDSVTHARAADYGPAAATDGAGPAIVSAQTVTTTTVQVTFSEAVGDASLVVGDFLFGAFATGGANTNATGISSGTANDAVVTLTLAAEIGPDETGTVAFTAASVASDLAANTSSQTAAVAVSDGIGAVPAVSSVRTGDADSDGQIDRLVVTFARNVDIADGSAADGFPQLVVTGYAIANANYAVANTTTLTLTLTESGSADTAATPNVTFANDGDVRDSVTHALAANYGPAAAGDGAGPAVVSAQTVTTTTVQLTFSEAVSDASLVAADFIFAAFATGGANANPTVISSGTANDAVVTLTLAAEIGPDETGTVAFTAAGVASDLAANSSSQTAAVPVSDGIGVVPAVSSVLTGDADSDGRIDRLVLTFTRNVDIADGSAADGFPQVVVTGYTIANANYAAANTTTLTLTLTESGSADTAATPNVAFTNDGDVRDSVTHALAANYGPAAASDGAGPAIVAAQTVTTTTVQVTFSEAISDASLAVGDFVFAAFATGGANTNPTGISSGTANDAVVTLTLAAEIGPDETGSVAFTAVAAAIDLAANTSSQTAAAAVSDGIAAVPQIASMSTGDADGNGKIDRLTVTFDKNVDIADGSAADGFPQVVVTGYTIANADYAAANTTTLTLTLTESGSADTGATPSVTFTNDGDVRDSVTYARAANHGPAAAGDGAGPAIVSAQTVTTTTVQVTFSEAVGDASLVVADFVFGAFATGGANANPTAISTGTANDAVVTLTLAAVIGRDETGTVALTAAGAASDPAANASIQTAAVPVSDGIPATPPVLSALTTADSDGDGYIDRLVATFDNTVDPATIVPARFSVDIGSVAGITNDAPDAPAAIWVNLTDGVLDTGRTPRLSIAADGIRDTSGMANATISLHPSVDNAAPVILYTLAVAGEPRIAVHFSEAVTGAGFTYSGASAVLSVPTGGTSTRAHMVVLAGDVLEDEVTAAAPDQVTVDASVVDAVSLPVDPAGRSHRVSDLGLGIIAPVWAISSTASGATVTRFDGTEAARAGDITLQAAVLTIPPAATPKYAGADVTTGYPAVDLVYDVDVAAAYLSNGLWLPTAVPGLVPAADPTAQTLSQASSLNALRDYLISDPAIRAGTEIQFFFKVGSLVHAGVVSPADPNSVAAWRLPIVGLAEQRGRVTIANNVINPAAGETTRLTVELEKRGSLSVTVFDLKGDIVQVLHRGTADAGAHAFTWDGSNRGGRTVARGIYFIKIVASGLDEVRKVLVVK